MRAHIRRKDYWRILLTCLCMVGVFITTWIQHGLRDRHTAITGAILVAFVFLTLGLIRSRRRSNPSRNRMGGQAQKIPGEVTSASEHRYPVPPAPRGPGEHEQSQDMRL